MSGPWQIGAVSMGERVHAEGRCACACLGSAGDVELSCVESEQGVKLGLLNLQRVKASGCVPWSGIRQFHRKSAPDKATVAEEKRSQEA
eukprot:COSAG01_NODE_4743_length_4771_cov_36.935360_4_plen_89_part_00